MGTENGTEQQLSTETALQARLDTIEAKITTLAAQFDSMIKPALDIGLLLSQMGEYLRNQQATLRDMEELISREARATRTMIRLAPADQALVASAEARQENERTDDNHRRIAKE
jgi:hypothetical protein